MPKHEIFTDTATWLNHFAKVRGEKETVFLQNAINLYTPAQQEQLEKGMGIANILLELGLDSEGVAASIVYPALQNHDIHFDTVAEHLGESSAKLLRDAQQMRSLEKLQHLEQRAGAQLENLRKMLLAMASDVRAVLITLAERLWLLRAAKTKTAEQKKLAQETLDLYTPLANRLGVGQLKWEMEDLCLRYLKPDVYKEIAKKLDSKRTEREKYIEQMMQLLRDALTKAGIKNFEITGRVKHIYSIYRKMQRKNADYSEIYDISAVRVLVKTIEDCYGVLGVVHGQWQQIPKEFDDYITHPKPNGYRSIHTAIVGPEHRNVEVQIRTQQMHQESELGVAAHWRYKEGGAQASSYEAKIAWLRQIMEWQKEVSGDKARPTQEDLFADRVYVFTPAGDIIDLPQGSTPLDFAYNIHSEVGHRCKGAKVDGHIVQLTHALNTGDRVEILTTKQPNPSRDWLNPHLGYLKSPRARAKLQHWFRALDEAQEEKKPQETLEKVEKVVKVEKITKTESPKRKIKDDIQIVGVGSFLTQMSKCCKPVPGDPIIGYIALGKGVSIHRRDCENVLRIKGKEAQRLVEVEWGTKLSKLYPVDIYLRAFDRHGLLRDITTLLAAEKINLLGIHTGTDKNSNEAHVNLTIEIQSMTLLSKIIDHLKHLPNVLHAERKV